MELLSTLSLLRPRLLRVLARRLGSVDAAHDVIQSLSEQLVSVDSKLAINNPEAYIFRAASNAASSYHRQASTRQAYETLAAMERDEIEVAGPDGVVHAEDALRVIERALDELPILTKRMFLDFRVHGMAQRDIAAKCKVSLSTVEKRIAKATLHCHRRLRESADPAGGLILEPAKAFPRDEG